MREQKLVIELSFGVKREIKKVKEFISKNGKLYKSENVLWVRKAVQFKALPFKLITEHKGTVNGMPGDYIVWTGSEAQCYKKEDFERKCKEVKKGFNKKEECHMDRKKFLDMILGREEFKVEIKGGQDKGIIGIRGEKEHHNRSSLIINHHLASSYGVRLILKDDSLILIKDIDGTAIHTCTLPLSQIYKISISIEEDTQYNPKIYFDIE